MIAEKETGDDHDGLHPNVHPLKIFDAARSQGRFLYACAPMVRYGKLAFRQTVFHYGTDLCWTPMILAKEFNRNQFARYSDLTVSTRGPRPPTIVQFGANSPLEVSRAASLVAPFVNGVDLNCGCPQSWACTETLGAALMEKRELVRDMVLAMRTRLADDGWAVSLRDHSSTPQEETTVGFESTKDSPKGKSVSIKIRVHKDLRRTMDFITTVLGNEHHRNIDWLTIHPRTRHTPSSVPINLDALRVLTDTWGDKLPILVSGDVFTLSTLPYTSHLLQPQPTFATATDYDRPTDTATKGMNSSNSANSDATSQPAKPTPPHLPKLAGLMSARALLANPALFAGHETCPWEAVDLFMSNVARAPLPFKLATHHLNEMCGPGVFGSTPNGNNGQKPLLTKKERMRLNKLDNWVDVMDFMDEVRKGGGNESGDGGIVRIAA